MDAIPVIKWCNHEFKNESAKFCLKCKRKRPLKRFPPIDFKGAKNGR